MNDDNNLRPLHTDTLADLQAALDAFDAACDGDSNDAEHEAGMVLAEAARTCLAQDN